MCLGVTLCAEQRKYYYYFERNARERGDDPFLSTESRTVTFKDAFDSINAVAVSFMNKGVKKGDIVVHRATRSVDTLLIIPALLSLGAVIVLADAHKGAEDYVAASGVDITPDYYLTNEDFDGGLTQSGHWRLKTQSGEILRPTLDYSPSNYEVISALNAKVNPDDAAIIVFTSGSTSSCKAVTLSQTAFIENAHYFSEVLDETRDDIGWLAMPLYHMVGLTLFTTALFTGHSLFIPSSIKPDYSAMAIAKYKATVTFGVPTYLISIADEARRTGVKLSTLRYVLTGAGPITSEQMEYVEESVGCPIVQVYGLSEYIGVTCCKPSDPADIRLCGVGKLLPYVDLKIDGATKPSDCGEILLKGVRTMIGYYNNPDATAQVFSDGYFRTGDIGYTDERGLLHISGRIKDVIIRAGENISARKIELALLEVGGIADAAVVGKKDARMGEVPYAFVTLKSGVELTAPQIKIKIAGLCKHEMPTVIQIVDSIPKTSTGKTDKRRLKEELNSK